MVFEASYVNIYTNKKCIVLSFKFDYEQRTSIQHKHPVFEKPVAPELLVFP